MDLTDRLVSSTYADDPPVGVGVATASTEEWVLWIPERLWDRVLALGVGYDLHRLKLMQGEERVLIGVVQVPFLVEELTFLRETTTDPLLLATLSDLIQVATRVLNESLLEALVIEKS